MNNNIVTACVAITGTRPLWFHRFGPDAIPLEKREKSGVAGNDPEEWRRTVLVTSDGQLYIEPAYAFAALRDAAKYTKRGRGNLQTAIVATMQIVDDRILVDRFMPGHTPGDAYDVSTAPHPPHNPEHSVYIDVRGVRNPTTKGQNVRYRVACSKGWHCCFSIMWDKTIVSRGEMEAICIDSGKLVGIGNGRSIGMGRFELAKFEVIE